MTDFLDHLSASDSDIFDLLISGRQRLTSTVLRELARDRGIFYSPEDTREDLAHHLSMLPHDFHDIAGIVQKREPAHRREKVTFIRLDSQLSVEEIKAATSAYAEQAGVNESVTHRPHGKSNYSIKVEYDEFNHSRTRLLQREHHEAVIELFEDAGQTVARIPATEKAKRVFSSIKEIVEQARKKEIQEEKIELTRLKSPELRSRFFTKLISSIPEYRLKNVMNLRVSSLQSDWNEGIDDAVDPDESLDDDAASEMFAAVHSMALSGQNLVQSQEYKELTARGFYITSITWRSEHSRTPNDIVQFEAGFEDRLLGTGFRYQIQGVFRAHKGSHRKSISQVSAPEKTILFSTLERTAREILNELCDELTGITDPSATNSTETVA